MVTCSRSVPTSAGAGSTGITTPGELLPACRPRAAIAPRLFTVDGSSITADELNRRLGLLAGARVTAKDFRTWHGTRVAFASLRRHRPPDETRTERVLNAIDAASAFLNNTRTVARAHYVHPHVIGSYLDGTFTEVLALRRPPRAPGLDADERALVGFLATLLDQHLHAL